MKVSNCFGKTVGRWIVVMLRDGEMGWGDREGDGPVRKVLI